MTAAVCSKCGTKKSEAFSVCGNCRTANRERRNLKETALHRNAFYILGATARDNRLRIVELAEEQSLELDHDVCQKARSDLTNPRTRLAAEMAWLPGVSPKKAVHLARQILEDPMSVRSKSRIPPLARANLMAAAFEAVDTNDEAEDIAAFIREMAHLVDEIAIENVLRDINEDRAVSGFPSAKVGDQAENELAERKRYFRSAVRNALDRLPSALLVEAVTCVVDTLTAGGTQHAPEFVDELVDSCYEVETHQFLEDEAENIYKLIKAAWDSANSGEAAVKLVIDKLESVVRNWDNVAQPIQLSAQARGLDHGPSNEVANYIRSLGVDLFNQHDMLAQSKRTVGLLQELFSELPDFAVRADEDAKALEDISRDRESHYDEWAGEITYHADIGMAFKNTLSISPTGISWKEKHYPLNTVTTLRWGGVRHSINGIPTGTTYTIAFGDDRSEAVVQLKRKKVYSTFVEKLWRAVGSRILTELIQALKSGQEIWFGKASVRDDGVTLIENRFFRKKPVHVPWYQTQIWPEDGALCIAAKEDSRVRVKLSYIYTPNVHILEQVIRSALSKPGMRLLSDVLEHD
jgi:hypothetical protein